MSSFDTLYALSARFIPKQARLTQYLTLFKKQLNSKSQSKKAVTEYLVKDEDAHTRHW